jgi:hypothetical protein
MIDGRTVSADVRAVGNAGAALGKELLDIITEGVMRNAAVIRDFTTRKEELLHVEAEFLYWFSYAVCLYFARREKEWDAAKVTSVMEDLTVAMARSFRYTAALPLDQDVAQQGQRLRASLQSVYEHVSRSFDRVVSGELLAQGEQPAGDALLTLNMLYVTKVYPASAVLMCSLNPGEMGVVFQIQSAFGMAVWSAFRHLQWGGSPG